MTEKERNSETDDDLATSKQLDRIAEEFWHYLVYANSVEQIREHLLKHGYSEELVDEYLNNTK